MISHPTSATGTATGANESMSMSTPAPLAMPAMSRFELVPIIVVVPARVVACAAGSSTGPRRDVA